MKCPICQNETLDDKDYEYQICEECFWEYDLLQVKNPNLSGGANKQSLNEYKKIYFRLKQKNPGFSCKNIKDREQIIKINNRIE